MGFQWADTDASVATGPLQPLCSEVWTQSIEQLSGSRFKPTNHSVNYATGAPRGCT